MIRCLLALALVLGLAACQSDRPAKANAPNGTAPSARSDAGTPGASPTGAKVPRAKPEDRMRLYYDLNQHTREWAEARASGDSVTWTSIERTLLRPAVDKHLEELLRTVAKKDEGELRITAARALGFGSEKQRIVPALVAVLTEKNANLVSSALASLYVLAVPDTPIGPLSALLNNSDTDVRANAALALYAVLRARHESGGVQMTDDVKTASGLLLSMVSNTAEGPSIRGNAIAALGEIGDPAATDVYVNLLTDPSSEVRIRAAGALGQLGREQAIPPLIDALGRSKSPNEARVLVAALEKIALLQHFAVDTKALGTDSANWTAWYQAIKGS